MLWLLTDTSTFRNHGEEVAYHLAHRNEPDVPLTLMADCSDAAEEGVAVEPEPTHAELHARLKLSVELVKMNRRVAELERQVTDLRAWVERMEAAGVKHLRPTAKELWPGGVDAKGDPLLNKANDAAVAARMEARKL